MFPDRSVTTYHGTRSHFPEDGEGNDTVVCSWDMEASGSKLSQSTGCVVRQFVALMGPSFLVEVG
jgi:hypothetical protein